MLVKETFKKSHNFEQRQAVSKNICTKYPDRIPVVIEAHPKTKLPLLDKQKFLVPKEITLGKFIFEVRKHIKLEPTDAIFIFVQQTVEARVVFVIPPTSALMSHLYERYNDADGFLYLTYSGENTFGMEASLVE